MKKTLFTLLFGILLSSNINAQQITINKSWGSNVCSMNGKVLKINELVSLMEENAQSFEQIKKAKKNYSAASVFGFAGGALLGWPIGTSLGGGDANWSLAGIGAGLIAIGIPFNNKYNKNIRAAVDNYNAQIQATSHYQFQPKLQINTSSNGLGIALIF